MRNTKIVKQMSEAAVSRLRFLGWKRDFEARLLELDRIDLVGSCGDSELRSLSWQFDPRVTAEEMSMQCPVGCCE